MRSKVLPYIWDWLAMSFEISPFLTAILIFIPFTFVDWLINEI